MASDATQERPRARLRLERLVEDVRHAQVGRVEELPKLAVGHAAVLGRVVVEDEVAHLPSDTADTNLCEAAGLLKQEAREAILGKAAIRAKAASKAVDSGSPGLQALITRTGADKAEPGIRRLVNQESSVLVDEDQLFVNKLIFWVDDKSNPGIVVDAKQEQKRIMSNQALGKPINEGEIPKVRRKQVRKGLLDF